MSGSGELHRLIALSLAIFYAMRRQLVNMDYVIIVIVGADIVGGVVIVETTLLKLPTSIITGIPGVKSTVSSTRLAVVSVDNEAC